MNDKIDIYNLDSNRTPIDPQMKVSFNYFILSYHIIINDFSRIYWTQYNSLL